jgi:hypothetical protein
MLKAKGERLEVGRVQGFSGYVVCALSSLVAYVMAQMA